MPATSTQSGLRSIRTGPNPETPARSGPARVLDVALTFWGRLSLMARAAACGALLLLVMAAAASTVWRQSHRWVALYPSMTAEDVTELSPRLTALGANFTVQGNSIMLDATERPHWVAVLLTQGFPRAHAAPPPTATGIGPVTDAERRANELAAVRADLTNQFQLFDFVTFATINLTSGNEDAIPPLKPTASIIIHPRDGVDVGRPQIQAMVNLVAGAVSGIDASDIRIVDTRGRVWYDGKPHASNGDDAPDDEHLAVKRAYERAYEQKLTAALNRLLGADNYALTVNADLDFSQVKVVERTLGGPDGTDRVTTGTESDSESYEPAASSHEDAAASPVSADAAASDGRMHYKKVRYRTRTEVGTLERTAIVAPGAVRRLSASVVVDGKITSVTESAVRDLVCGALGHDADILVSNLPLHRDLPPTTEPAPPVAQIPAAPTPWILIGLVPTLLTLAAACIWLSRTRDTRLRQRVLEVRPTGDATLTSIADLLNDKRGTTAATHATTVSAEPLEAWARERPSRVAQHLRATWLADRER